MAIKLRDRLFWKLSKRNLKVIKVEPLDKVNPVKLLKQVIKDMS